MLGHMKYFTQGCDKLVIVTDHRPLVGLFHNKNLDQIENPRLFSLKQKSMSLRGKDNKFADATSRNPASSDDPDDEITDREILAAIMCIDDDNEGNMTKMS